MRIKQESFLGLSVLTPRMALCSLVALGMMLLLVACGKKTDPVPDQSQQLFSWRNVFATMTENGCISLSGSVAGASQNMTDMVLELQPLDASCEGCPFVPQENHRVDAGDAWESPSGDSFRFAYCPNSRAQAYRWRLAGHNVFTALPPVLTPVRIVQIMSTSAADEAGTAPELEGGDKPSVAGAMGENLGEAESGADAAKVE